MHADDIDDVINGKNQWQQHSMANRKALMNPSIDGGKAYAENQRLYNNTLDIAQKSKSKVANLLTVEPLIRDPKKRSLLTDDAVTAIDNAGLKVTNPKYKALNPNDIHFKDKPFDLADQSKVQGVLKNIKPEQVENEPIIDKKNGTQTINYTPKFDKNSLLNMYGMASDLYASHPGFKSSVDQHADLNDAEYKRLNDIWEQHFAPIEGFNKHITTPQDMAAAKFLELNPNFVPKQSVTKPISGQSDIAQSNKLSFAKKNSDIAFNRHKETRLFDNANPTPNAATNAAANGTKIVDDAIALAKADPAKYKQLVTHPDGTKETQWIMPIDQEVRNKLSRKDPGTGKLIAPLEVRFSDDGTKVTPIFYQGAINPQTGKRAINPTFSVPMPRSDFEAVVADVHKAKGSVKTENNKTVISKEKAAKMADELLNKYRK